MRIANAGLVATQARERLDAGWQRLSARLNPGAAVLAAPADAAAAISAVVRASLSGLRRAGGETRAVLIFIAALSSLMALPKPDASEPAAGLRADRPEADGRDTAVPYARAPWLAVQAGLAGYALQSPELGAPIHRIRAIPGSDARQELMVFADERAPARGGLFIERGAPPERLADSLYVEAARRAAVLGASIDRLDQATPVDTKFGGFEAADAQITQNGRPQACLAFRLLADSPIAMTGLMCGSPELPMDRTRLACILDRLDLVGAGDDRALRQFFATAERSRIGCARAPAGRTQGLNRVLFDGARIRG